MNIRERVRGAMRRVGEVSLRELVSAKLFARAGSNGRRTVGAGSNLAPFSSSGITKPGHFGRTGVSAPHNFALKPTPANLRRFAETPVARRAINVIKDRIAGMKWRIQARRGRSLDQIPEGALRTQILTENFEAPNPDDSFRSLLEQVLEDVIVGGFGAIELDRVEGWSPESTGSWRTGVSAPHGPLLMWPVDGASIRMITDWDGRPDSPRYVQATGSYGPAGQIVLNDDELSYIRLNPRTHTPFGLGRVEVAFETINSFLSAHRYASRLASNSVVQYALWLQDLSPAHHERLIRWWQDEIEGTGRVPILSVESKPEVLRFGAGTDADLRLSWQEFLLRVIADAFDLPAQFLGVERDVNRSTAAEMNELAFRSAIVPTARLVAEHLTRDAIGKKLGWTDLEFVFTDVDAADEMQQAQIDEILLRNGVVTVNEVRRARGLAELV
ncbi:MAG TPA: phage portal protein [Terriglobales bacterium]|nr:phage portal protein [Terriglobales bacterium]